MKKRKLGRSNPEVSAMGLGCMGIQLFLRPPQDNKEMTAVLHAAVERGITFFDKAEVYGPYVNEAPFLDVLRLAIQARGTRPLRIAR